MTRSAESRALLLFDKACDVWKNSFLAIKVQLKIMTVNAARANERLGCRLRLDDTISIIKERVNEI